VVAGACIFHIASFGCRFRSVFLFLGRNIGKVSTQTTSGDEVGFCSLIIYQGEKFVGFSTIESTKPYRIFKNCQKKSQQITQIFWAKFLLSFS